MYRRRPTSKTDNDDTASVATKAPQNQNNNSNQINDQNANQNQSFSSEIPLLTKSNNQTLTSSSTLTSVSPVPHISANNTNNLNNIKKADSNRNQNFNANNTRHGQNTSSNQMYRTNQQNTYFPNQFTAFNVPPGNSGAYPYPHSHPQQHPHPQQKVYYMSNPDPYTYNNYNNYQMGGQQYQPSLSPPTLPQPIPRMQPPPMNNRAYKKNPGSF
jgi:hypothetical protein